jgi:hypothetical protein
MLTQLDVAAPCAAFHVGWVQKAHPGRLTFAWRTLARRRTQAKACARWIIRPWQLSTKRADGVGKALDAHTSFGGIAALDLQKKC